MNATGFFDQVLDQIELGYPGEAIARLMVMLDIAVDERTRLEELQDVLTAHPLLELLKHDPGMAAARDDLLQRSTADGRIDRLVALICSPAAAPGNGPHATASMLGNAMATGMFYRAIQARVRHADDMLVRAWQGGRAIAVIGGTLRSEFAGLQGRDLANLTIADGDVAQVARLSAQLGPSARIAHQSPEQLVAAAGAAGASFDLIYFPRVLETTSAADLVPIVAQAATMLAPGGAIVMPRFLPTRIGRGWQQICLDWQVLDHPDTALIAALAPAGLSLRTITDSAGCLAWLTLTPRAGDAKSNPMRNPLGDNHAH